MIPVVTGVLGHNRDIDRKKNSRGLPNGSVVERKSLRNGENNPGNKERVSYKIA